MKRFIFGVLAVSVMLCACGKKTAVVTETDVSVETTTFVQAETTVTKEITKAALETTTVVETTAAPAENEPAEMQNYVSLNYNCQLAIPAGWTTDSVAEDKVITESTSMFQPEVPNGDSISLAVQETSEDPEVFAAITADEILQAYGTVFDTAEIAAFEAVTLCDCPGYYVVIQGNVNGISMEMTQLMVNCTDTGVSAGGHLYMVTYTNASGEETDYPEHLTEYFRLSHVSGQQLNK